MSEEQKTNIPVDETGKATKKVTLDVEIEPRKVADIGPNPYQKLIHLAEAVDAWRLFPRAFISVYMFLLIHVVIWFTHLENPSMEQSGLISVVVGAGAAWFGLYTGSGKGKSVKVNKTE
jgi:hypothetical protein